MHSKIVLFAVALGMLLVPGACGETDPRDEQPVEEPPVEEPVYPDEPEQILRDLEIESVVLKKTMRYSVWLPEGYNPGKKYPILYLLHGAGDDNNSWLDKGNARGYARNYLDDDGVPMIIVMPDAQGSGYQGSWEIYCREELMGFVESNWPFNGKRALAGLSMGGYGTLRWALKYPDRFTYAYSMSPAVNFGSMTEFINAQEDKSVFPPFTVEVGLQDMTVNNDSAKELVDYMADAGLSVEWVERAGGHDWKFWKECLRKALIVIGDSFKE